MFCNNCGRALADGSRFCDNCGTPMPQQQPVGNEPPVAPGPTSYTYTNPAPQAAPYVAPAPAKKSKKGLIIGLVAGGAVILTVVLLLVFLLPKRYKSPEAVSRAMVTAYAEMDMDTMVDCMPDFIFEGIGIKDKNAVKDLAGAAIAASGATAPRSCRIISVARDYDVPYTEVLEEIYDVASELPFASSMPNIQEACVMEVTAIVDGETEEMRVVCMKIGGYWYALPGDM